MLKTLWCTSRGFIYQTYLEIFLITTGSDFRLSTFQRENVLVQSVSTIIHSLSARWLIISFMQGIIDYIFYTRTQLKCLGVLGGLDPEWFKSNNIVGCPHPHVPSDHICLVTEFQLLPPGYQQGMGSGLNSQQNGNLYSNHPQPYSLLFNQQHQQTFVTTGSGSVMSSNNFQTHGRFSAPGSNRPGSANSLTHSPINMLNGNNSGLTMTNMGLHGAMGMNGRR